MRFAAFVLVAGSAVCCAGVAQAGGASLNGSWAGEMRQVDPEHESRYPMTLVLKGKTGSSAYPTLKCTGVWTRIATAKDGYAIYQEKAVNEPGGTCVDGLMTVKADGSNLIVGWFAVVDEAPSLASAVLASAAK